MSVFTEYINTTKSTPQTERTPGRTDEVKNNAGGYVFKADDKQNLERFLILGTAGGTYYVTEKNLTKDNAKFVIDLIKSNERLVVDTIVDVARKNRAYKNSPSLFATALVLTYGVDKDYMEQVGLVTNVARTATHLYELVNYVKDLGGFGRGKRRLVNRWFTSKTPDQLAYQSIKFRSRSV